MAGNWGAGHERKTVTALFADIKGSMELIEDLDPEEPRRLRRAGADPIPRLYSGATSAVGHSQLSDEASFVTAAEFVVDGGYTAV